MKKQAFGAAALLGVMVLFLLRSAVTADAVRRGLSLCAHSVLPALGPYFVLSSLFVSLGFDRPVGRLLGPVFTRLTGVSGVGVSAFFLGLLGGYPVGARTLSQLYRSGRLTRWEAQRLLSFCNNAGPSFAVGILGLGCFHSLRAGAALYLIHVAAALLVALLPVPRSSHASLPSSLSSVPPRPPLSLLPALVQAIASATALLQVCAFVVFFMALSALFSDITGLYHPLLLGFLELTGGAARLGSGKADFIMAAAILGWGGLSVHGQTAAVLADTGLRLPPYLLCKALQALLSAALAAALVSFLPFSALF